PRVARRLVAAIVSAVDAAAPGPAQERVGSGPEPVIELSVRYGGAEGPDLAEVADRLGLSPERVVGVHSSHSYRVLAIGFMPGFAYLGPLADQLRLPRRADPRTEVPAGTVA